MNTQTCTLLLVMAAAVPGQTFYLDDPLMKEPAPGNASGAINRKISDYYDFLQHSFAHPGERAITATETIAARAVNTLGEPMDGAWYTKRHYYHRMSTEELVRGPGNTSAPAADKPWTIVKAKSEGVTPGFEIVDSKGRRYVLKFDPPDYLELATAPDVISSKFFYALGYYVPENYIVHFRAEQLHIKDGVKLVDATGKAHSMQASDLTALLAKLPRDRDQRYRAVASLYLAGKPVGPFKYFGTRKDDPNDIVSHEHRRDLRGLRVFSAWLGHDDSRAINTLDMLVDDGGTPYIRHHLIDFGSTLGSASNRPNSPRANFDNLFAWKPALQQFFTLGTMPPYWASAHYDDAPALGRFEAEKFNPERWVPEYPNPAFANMLPEDAFWAAKQVMAFTDDDIRAIVATGEYSDPAVAERVSALLIARRDKIGKAFLNGKLALDRFAIRNGELAFDDLGATARGYTFRWFVVHEGFAAREPVAGAVSPTMPTVPGALLMCEITDDQPGEAIIRVHVRSDSREVIGVTRKDWR